MQIVEPGRQQKGWAIETKCTGCGNGGGGCGALLRIEQGDLYRTSSAHYDGSVDHYVTFTCGACGVESDLTWATVPSAVRETLPSKSAWLERRRQEVGDTTAAPTVSDFERGWRAAHRAALEMLVRVRLSKQQEDVDLLHDTPVRPWPCAGPAAAPVSMDETLLDVASRGRPGQAWPKAAVWLDAQRSPTGEATWWDCEVEPLWAAVERLQRAAAPSDPQTSAMTIEDLRLTRRVTNMLTARGIGTVDNLCSYSARSLRQIDGMGLASFAALGRALHRVGRRLAPPLRQDHAESLTAWLRTCGADELVALGLREPGHGAPAPRRTQ